MRCWIGHSESARGLGPAFRAGDQGRLDDCQEYSDRLGVGKVKHMHTRFLWVQEQIQADDFRVSHVVSHKNVADLLTKPIAARAMQEHLEMIGLVFAQTSP